MEAKVDVRKLQILNDRINQTIDALSQVRFSVHGLGHTGVPTKMMNPFGTIPQGFGYPTYPSFLGIPPVPPVPVIPPIPGLYGLSHTPFAPPVNPFPFTPPVNPMFQTPFTSPVNPSIPTPGITPTWGVPPTPWFGTGLFHSSPEPIERLLEVSMLDPYKKLELLRNIELLRSIEPYKIHNTFPFLNF